jgi:hypothetical protein
MTSKIDQIYDPMTAANPIHILDIKVVDTPVLEVRFDDGLTALIDFSDIIKRSRWFHTLSVPTTFADVEVVNDGRALQWITGADYCADALRILADEQAKTKRKSA